MKTLIDTHQFKVRFNEADPLGIVWHGHYIKYFEDGREGFGHRYDLTYLDIFNHGFFVPIVNINCDFKKTLKYGQEAIVETMFVDCLAAKIIFNFRIVTPDTNQLVATGSSTQVFLDKQNNQLQLSNPDFFLEWKKKWL